MLTFEPMVTDDVEGTWTNSVDEDFMNSLQGSGGAPSRGGLGSIGSPASGHCFKFR